MALKAKTLADIARVLRDHGEEEGRSLFLHDSFAVTLAQSTELVILLERKMRLKGWKVNTIKYIKSLVEIDGELKTADELLDDLITRTDPVNVVVHVAAPSRRSGSHVGAPLRVAGLASASGRRRGRAALTTGPSVRGARNSWTTTRGRRRRAGRRHRLPRVVPHELAQELLDIGNHVEKESGLRPIEVVGEALAAVGLSLLRQKKDTETLHADLLGVKAKVAEARGTEMCLKDLM